MSKKPGKKKVRDFMRPIASIEIGGITADELLKKLRRKKILTNEWSEKMIRQSKTLPKRFKVDLVEITFPKEMPSEKLHLRPIFEAAIEKGLCLLPAIAAPDILLQLRKGKLNEAVLAMLPTDCLCNDKESMQKNCLTFFDKPKQKMSRGIYARCGNIDEKFGDGGKMIFAYQCPELIETGCITLPRKPKAKKDK